MSGPLSPRPGNPSFSRLLSALSLFLTFCSYLFYGKMLLLIGVMKIMLFVGEITHMKIGSNSFSSLTLERSAKSYLKSQL